MFHREKALLTTFLKYTFKQQIVCPDVLHLVDITLTNLIFFGPIRGDLCYKRTNVIAASFGSNQRDDLHLWPYSLSSKQFIDNPESKNVWLWGPPGGFGVRSNCQFGLYIVKYCVFWLVAVFTEMLWVAIFFLTCCVF